MTTDTPRGTPTIVIRFSDEPSVGAEYEHTSLAHTLRGVADEIEQGMDGGTLSHLDGSRGGHWYITPGPALLEAAKLAEWYLDEASSLRVGDHQFRHGYTPLISGDPLGELRIGRKDGIYAMHEIASALRAAVLRAEGDDA